MMKVSNPRIAIVDDDESIQKSLRRLLTGVGFEVGAFASGAEFLLSMETRSPGCVLLDAQMSGINGLELQARLTAAGHRIPILFITAHDNPPVRAKALAGGAVAFIDKPVKKDLLITEINRSIKSSG
jgi:two-component system, LuxR family, response regulator FixJ